MNEQEKLIAFNQAIKGMVDILLQSKTPFFLTIDPTKGWEPPLPAELCSGETVLFNIDGDAFSDCVIHSDYTEIYVAISNPTSGYVLHRYKIGDKNRVSRIIESTNGQPSSLILCKPQSLFNIVDSDEDIGLHSMEHFLTNPNNAKFFK